ncbi:MAG: toxin glutamine deamidase domain-containing protein [Olegusella sp.]|nr:toxin glutamine deamidase domain-containing protein [Olegusella sp.]
MKPDFVNELAQNTDIRSVDEHNGRPFDPDKHIEPALDGPLNKVEISWADEMKEKGHKPAERMGETDAPTIAEIRRWLPEINPNFDPYDSVTTNNCGSCALAVFRRLAGDMDATANEKTLGTPEMEKGTGRPQIPMSPDEIAKTLIERGPGSFAVIGIDRAEGPGHWFNAYCPDGKAVYAIDGQTGEIRAWPPYYGDVVNWDMSY